MWKPWLALVSRSDRGTAKVLSSWLLWQDGDTGAAGGLAATRKTQFQLCLSEYLQDGAPKIAFTCLKKWLNTEFYSFW